MILAIDPGPVESAYVVLKDGSIWAKGKQANGQMLEIVDEFHAGYDKHVVIEMIASYGMAVGSEVFETCVWIGRFIQMFDGRADRLTRNQIKNHLCHSSKAKDANIRQALIDRFGGPASIKKDGPLYKVSGDMWAALAVAVTWQDLHVSIAL